MKMEIDCVRPRSPSPRGTGFLLWALVWLSVCWCLVWLGPLSLVILVAMPLALWQAIRGRYIVAVVVLLAANPLSVSFLGGIADYLGGRPALRGVGLPSPEFANLDPQTRCRRVTLGCLVSGSEWVETGPHNLAIRVMAGMFGPPSGLYDGLYPTREEAVAASTPGLPVAREDFMAGRIATAEGVVGLVPTQVEGILRLSRISSMWSEGAMGEDASLHAALLGERCLVLRWREREDEVIYLVDAKSGKPFAVYKVSGRPYLPRAAVARFW